MSAGVFDDCGSLQSVGGSGQRGRLAGQHSDSVCVCVLERKSESV